MLPMLSPLLCHLILPCGKSNRVLIFSRDVTQTPTYTSLLYWCASKLVTPDGNKSHRFGWDWWGGEGGMIGKC